MTSPMVHMALFSEHPISCQARNCGRSLGSCCHPSFPNEKKEAQRIRWFTELVCDSTAALPDAVVSQTFSEEIVHVLTCPAGQTLTHSHYVRKFSRENTRGKPVARGMIWLGKAKYFLLLRRWNGFLPLFCCSVVLWCCCISRMLLMSPRDYHRPISICLGCPVLPPNVIFFFKK